MSIPLEQPETPGPVPNGTSTIADSAFFTTANRLKTGMVSWVKFSTMMNDIAKLKDFLNYNFANVYQILQSLSSINKSTTLTRKENKTLTFTNTAKDTYRLIISDGVIEKSFNLYLDLDQNKIDIESNDIPSNDGGS